MEYLDSSCAHCGNSGFVLCRVCVCCCVVFVVLKLSQYTLKEYQLICFLSALSVDLSAAAAAAAGSSTATSTGESFIQSLLG